MKVNRCIHCMREVGEGAAVCPHCGKRQECPPGYRGLRPNTILHGRYLTGLRGEDGTYIAFDLAGGKRMSVREFYPRSMARREGNAVVPSAPGGGWAKGLEEFLRLGNLLLQQPPDLNLPRVSEVFQENGTAYIVLDDPDEPSSGQSVYDRVKERDSAPQEVEIGIGGVRKLMRRPKIETQVQYTLGVETVLRPTAKNLQWLHRNGSLHRRIEPSGMRWHREGNCIYFRLPLPLLPDGTRINSVSPSGAPCCDAFTPLEELYGKGPTGPWTDVYSLCAVLYFYVTGHEPPNAVSRAHEGEWTAPLQYLPDDLTRSQRAVLEDGMAVFAKDRIQSIDELLRRVEESLKDPGGFDPGQNVPQVVYGPPPQVDEPNGCPSCGFRWTSPAMLPKPKFCPHCGKKLPGGAD